jgi:hypothetical protein
MGSVATRRLATREKSVIGYYGSSLNEFIDHFCTHEMTCINIDCLLVRVSKHRLRFIEFKHETEALKKSQVTAFRILKNLLNSSDNGWRCEFYVVRGNLPFQYATLQEVESDHKVTLSQFELIEWLEFEREVA